MQNIIFLKNTDPKNQIILFLSCRLTDPISFAVLLVDQKINLVSPFIKRLDYKYLYIKNHFIFSEVSVINGYL